MRVRVAQNAPHSGARVIENIQGLPPVMLSNTSLKLERRRSDYGVDALKHLDAESMGRLSACSRAFGKPEPARRFSLCALAAWTRLRADKAFRRPQDGKMPNADNVQAWGSEGFRGWLYVLRDWERAVAFERQGGFAAFDVVRPGRDHATIDELNKGAFSYRRMKWALGHFEVTSRGILDWIE